MAAELAIIAKLQDEASSGIRALRGEVEGLGDSGGIAAKGFQSLQVMGVAAIAAVGAAAVAAGAAIAGSIGVAADFQDAVTLLAIAAKGAGESFDSMRDAAMAVGADTSLVGVSAAGAAEAMTTLYKAGLTTGEIFGDLNGYLAGNVELSGALRAAIDGAAASELSMAQAADLAAITLATFGGEMKTTEERAAFVNMAMNNFVQTADASMASVADLAAAMETIGPTAAQFGFSLQDTNTALAILSTRGIKGAEAGTALKSMLNNLMSTTPGTTKALNELGVSIYNADGTMRQLPQIIGDLSQALYGLNERTVMVGGRTAEQNHQLELAQKSYAQATDAIYKHNAGLKTLTDAQLAKYINQQSAANAEIQRLEAITGKATTAVSQLTEEQRNQYIATLAGSYGMKAMATLLMEGTEGWTAMEKAIAAAATIQEVARARTETFSGAMEALDGVIETIRIGIGSAFLPVLTSLARAFADLAASNLPMIVDSFEAFGGALASFFDAIMGGTPVITAFADSVAGMAEMLGMPAEQAATLKGQIEGVLTAVGNVLGPIAQAVASFVSWKDVLVVLGIAIASVVVPALIAIAQFVAPIVAVFAGLVLAIAALRNAFETNFLGIRDLAESLWGSLQGVFEGIKALLSGDTTAAMAAFRSAWETGWNAIVGFIQNAGGQIGAALAGLWQSITAWFQGIDWAALGQSLVEKFLAGMAALGQAAAGSWEWLLTSLTSFIQSVDWGQLGYTLIDLLIKGIVGAIGLIGTALAGLVTFIWNFITGTNWIELGVNLVSAIIEGLKSFGEGAGAALAEWRQVIFDWAGAEDWSGVAEHIAEMVGTALGEMAEAITGQLSEWQTAIFDWAGAEDWSGVAEHIAEMVGEALGEMAEAITGQLSEWQTAIFDWAGAEDWGDVAEHIAEMVGEALGEMAEAITGQLSEWQTAIFDWAGAEDWSGVAEAIAEMVGEALGEMAEAITGQLSEWQTAIFDWAGAEDWSGVAEHIAEMVGEAMGGASDSVISTLGDWEKAIFDWAGAEDWGGVAEEIAVAVGDSLVEVSDKVTEKLSGWIQAFTDWVGTVDWYQIGYDIMFAITDAFLDFKTMITEKIGTWLGDTKTATEGYAWYEVGAYILLEIAKSAAGLVSDWTAAVGAWVSNIGSAIQQHMANLAQVGADIVGGIVAGINAAADLIRGAIAGAAGASVPAAADAVGAQSPARKLIPVGMDISAGIAVGITQGAGTIISAINGVAGATELEAVKAFSEAVKAIGEAIQSAVLSFVLLNGFGGADTGGVAAGLASMALLMKSIVDAFAEANSHSAEALDEVGKFADVAGALVGLIAESLLPMRILSAIDLSFLGSANLGAGLAAMRDFLIAMVAAFADAAAELGVMGQLVEAFTSAAESVIGLVEDGLRAAALLAGFNFGAVVQGWHLQQQIIIFRNIVATMVREFADAALELAFMSEGVQLFTEAAEGVIGLVEDGLHATMLLSGFNFGAAVQGWHLQQQIITFRNIVATMVREFADAALELGYMGESVEAFTGAAEGVIGLVEDGLHATMLLSGFNFGAAVQGWHLQQQIIIFRNIVRTMVREFAEAALEFGSMADSVSAFADAAEGVIGLVEDGLSAAVALSEIDFGPVVNGWHLATQIETFRNIIRTMIREFSEAATEFGSMADSVEAFADAADAVLGLVIEGIAAVSALSETDFGAIVQGWHLATQIETFRNIIRTMMREFSEAATEFGSMADSVEAFADAAGAVVDLVGPAIEAIGLLANYAPDAAGLSAAMQQFVADLMALTLALATGFQQVAAQIGEGVGAAAEFAGDAEDIVDVVEPGIEALAALAGYVSATGVAAAVGLFAADLVMLVRALGAAFAAASVELGTAAGQAAEFAGDAEDIVDVVEPGIEALAALAGYVSATGVAAAVGLFAADLVTIVRALGAAFEAASVEMGEAAAQAAEFAGHAEDIVGVVEPGIEALAALAGYVAGADLAAKTTQFTGDLVMVTQLLVAGLTQSALAAGEALVQASAMGQSIKQLFEVVKPALEALAALAAYSAAADMQAKATQFTGDLVAVAGTLVAGLNSAATQLGQEAIGAAQTFAAGVTGVVNEVKAAMTGLVELAGIQTPTIEATLAYIVTSSGQIVTSFSAAGDIGSAVGYAAAFRANLEQLVAEVQMAVAQLAALAGSGTSGSVQGALTAIATSLMNTEGQFAGAGTALAGALIAAMQTGIAAGLGAVVGAVVAVLGTTEAAGLNEANDFSAVGDAITEATADGVDGGQSQVIAAVVQVVAAAIAAGLNEAKKAGEIGEEVIRAVLGEMSSNRSSLDQAGSSSGEALIDGMVRAIAAGKSRLVNAIKDAVNSAVAAAKAALGIASPSKVAFDLMDNFMRTAAGRLGHGDELAAAVGRSIDAAMGTAAGQLAGAKLAAPVAVNAGLARTPVMPSVLPRPATAGAGPERSFGDGSINIYGNIVLPNVSNPVSFLEELDALRGGVR